MIPDQATYRSQALYHLGLVAGMFLELRMGRDHRSSNHQNPDMCDLTVGEAVKAMVFNGLELINQALHLVTRFFQHKPTYQLVTPRVTPTTQ